MVTSTIHDLTFPVYSARKIERYHRIRTTYKLVNESLRIVNIFSILIDFPAQRQLLEGRAPDHMLNITDQRYGFHNILNGTGMVS